MNDNIKSKDELYQLLKNGFIDEFNKYKPCTDGRLLDLSELELEGSEIPNTNFSNCDLTGSYFCDADVSESNLATVI